jgi:hypothetical protein
MPGVNPLSVWSLEKKEAEEKKERRHKTNKKKRIKEVSDTDKSIPSCDQDLIDAPP